MYVCTPTACGRIVLCGAYIHVYFTLAAVSGSSPTIEVGSTSMSKLFAMVLVILHDICATIIAYMCLDSTPGCVHRLESTNLFRLYISCPVLEHKICPSNAVCVCTS